MLRLKHKNKLPLIIGLIVIIIISFFIRTYHIADESLYGDEPYSIFHAQKSLPELKEIFLHDQNPPMHIALLHFWLNIFGISDVAAKMLSVICTVFAGLLLFLFARKFLNLQAAVIVSFFFLFSNSQQYFSTEVRPYALIQLLCISSFYVYFNILTTPKKRDIVLLWLINLALLFTHYLSVFILVVQFLFIWFYLKENKRSIVFYFVSQALLVVSFLPWLQVLISNMPKEGSFWNHAPSYDEFRWHTNVLVGSETLFYVFNLLIVISLLLVVFNRRLKILNSDFKISYYFIFIGLYVFPIALDYYVSQKTPVFLTRYILYTTFGLFLSLAYFFSSLNLKVSYKAVLLAPFLLVIAYSFTITQEREDEWEKMVPIVKKKQDKNTVIFVSASYKFKDFAFYYDLEAFKNYTKSAEMLAKKGVFFSPDDQWFGWNKLNYDTINKIIYVHSHAQFEDPEHAIEKFIISKGFKECDYYNRVNTGYAVYIRDTMDCYPVKLVKPISNEKCSIFKKYLALGQGKDTCLFFTTNFIENYNCDPKSIIVDTADNIIKYVVKIDSLQTFGPTLLIPEQELKKFTTVSVKAKYRKAISSRGALAISLEGNGEIIDRQETKVYEKLNSESSWNLVQKEYTLPIEIPSESELKVYFWNPGSGFFYIEEMVIILYGNKNELEK
jgi:uncharacterized membrane protein